MYDKITLPNGVRILWERIPWARSVSCGVFIGVGSRYESPTESGSAHFIEHMFFKGTQHRSASQLAMEMDAIGGQINAYTTKEGTCFYGQVLADQLVPLADMLTDMFFCARLDDHDLRSERGVVFEEIDMYEDTPDDLVSERLYSTVFKGTPLARPILGRKTALSRMNGASLRRFMEEKYTPGRIVVALAGKIEDDGLEYLKERFSAMGYAPEPAFAPGRYTPGFTVRKKEIEQEHLCLGFPGLPTAHPDRFQQHMMNNILGGGMSSRLFQAVREQRGLCYSIYTFASPHLDTGVLGIYAALSHEAEKKALIALFDVLKRFLDEGVTEDEMERARLQVKANVIMSEESVGSTMHRLGRGELYLDKVYDTDAIVAAYDAVTREEILSLARRTFTPDALSLSAVGPVGDAADYRRFLSGLL